MLITLSVFCHDVKFTSLYSFLELRPSFSPLILCYPLIVTVGHTLAYVVQHCDPKLYQCVLVIDKQYIACDWMVNTDLSIACMVTIYMYVHYALVSADSSSYCQYHAHPFQ